MTIAHRSLVLIAASLLGLFLAACGGDEGGGGEVTSDTSATSAPSSSTVPDTTNVNLEAKLSGKDEVPGPGVTDGVGVAEIRIEGGEICYKLNATMGEMPTAAHIHTGAAGTSGPVLVNLMPAFTKGESGFKAENCLPPSDAVPPIAQNPAGYYVNVHTAEHPDGAMRGQLAKAPY